MRMKKLLHLLSLILPLSAGCFAATVAEMSGTVFTARSNSGSAPSSQPVVLYLAAAATIVYFAMRQFRRAQ